MRSAIILLIAVTLSAYAHRALAAEHEDQGARLFGPDEIQWQDGPKSVPPGAKLAVLEGDPTKDGPFVMRLQLPAGYKIPPHTHPKVERVTVISGTFNIVMGDKLDVRDARKMRAGSFGYWAAGMKHLVWAEGETVVQLHGIGPWSINYVNPGDDPRNKTAKN